MPKICYRDCTFRKSSLKLIETCNEIIAEYTADGLQLTLRQLYYQLVSRDVIPNLVREYNRLGNIVNDARLAGLIDWDAIEDRTRNVMAVPHFNTPQDVMNAAFHSYRNDKWADQPTRTEVWIEKEALAGVFERICSTLDVPYLSCRGYTSQSEMWGAAMRFVRHLQDGKRVTIFHFGDHDPSGIDMTRDIEDRLQMFAAQHVGYTTASRLRIKRVALNMDQVRQYNPPENPAKSTDTRFEAYYQKYGEHSWELDALNPRVLAALVRTSIESIRDEELWNLAVEAEAKDRALLSVAATKWAEYQKYATKKWKQELTKETENQIAIANREDE